MKCQKGFSLPEILMTLVIGSIGMLAFAKLLAWTAELQTQALELATFEGYKQVIARNLANRDSWANTLAANKQGAMACLWNQSPCTTSGAAGGPPLTNVPIQLFDSANKLMFDATNPQNGMTKKGTPCVGFSETQGNDNCPFRYEVSWTAVCTVGSCVTPQVAISAILRYSPAGGKALVLNTDRVSINQYYLPSPPACQGGSQVFGAPGTYSFRVPNGFTALLVEEWGGGGGGYAINAWNCAKAPGQAGQDSSFNNGQLVATGGAGGGSWAPAAFTQNVWIWCIWSNGPICGVLQWTQCPGGTALAIQGGNGYPESSLAAPPYPANMNQCGGSAGGGGGRGGANYSANGSAGGGGGAGNYSYGSWLVGGNNWLVFDQFWATGGGAVDPLSPGPTQSISPLPAPLPPSGERPWLNGGYNRGVYSPASLAPGSVVTVVVGAGGAGGNAAGAFAGNGAAGLVKVTWR